MHKVVENCFGTTDGTFLLSTSSVTRWIEYFQSLAIYSKDKFAQVANRLCQSGLIILPNSKKPSKSV